jgi:hypothetical protein
LQPHHGGEDYGEDKWLLEANPDVMVELHTNLVHNPRLRRAVHLDRATLLLAGDGDAEEATALLLVAAVHGATSHQFDRLQHVVDVLLLARGAAGAVDVGRLSRVAAGCGATETVASALQIAARVFRDPACRELAAALRGGTPAWLGGLLLGPGVVLRAQSTARSIDSWRRKVYRELLRR